mgnify:CR=1 FL=1
MFAASKTDSASTGGYQISRSLRFNQADSAYLNRTPASAGNRQIWTYSTWIKRSSLGSSQSILEAASGSADQYSLFFFTSGDLITLVEDQGSGGVYALTTSQVFRDVSAWYHIVIAFDTTQATSSNRIKLYVNGSQVTAFGTASYPAQNLNTYVNAANAHRIGTRVLSNAYINGYETEINLIDGQQLTPSSFGETNAQTGVWQPKAYSGSYGTNGFYLNFSDNSNTTAATLGKDYSGNGNNWTPNNFSVTAGVNNDSMVDVPTPYGVDTGAGGTVRGNYATWNSVTATPSVTFSDGNLKAVTASQNCAISTIGMASGKWYMEITVVAFASINLGLANSAHALTTALSLSANAIGYNGNGTVYYNSTTPVTYASYTTGDIIGIAFDADAGNVTFYKNGTLQGTPPVSLTNGPYFFAGSDGTGTAPTIAGNFGQRPFIYTAPSGFKALCTQNLPTPTIGATTATQANTFFAPALYTGNDGTQTVTTGIDMATSGGLVWFKNRSAAVGHALINPVVGYGSFLQSNTTGAENAFSFITATSSTGFTMNTGSSTFNGGAAAGGPFAYVAWNWKANGAGSTNTAGSITSTVSANTTSGFSVVTYTGTGANATVGHGLGVAPSMYIVKCRGTAGTNWPTYHQSITAANVLFLNVTDAQAAYSDVFNATNPTSSVFSIGTSNDTNGSTRTYVAYCFAEVAGYSKFGSYTGNGTAGDGPFVYTGFRPVFVMIKASSTTGDWLILDNSRSPYNVEQARLKPNDSAAEVSGDGYDYIDALSNGFKLRGIAGSNGTNGSGNTYIYMALAQNPFKYSLAR